MYWFSEKDTRLTLESTISRQKLDNNIKKVRVSDDFVLARDSLLKPWKCTSVQVRLDKKKFPDAGNVMLGMFKHFDISMRSCFAQSWIHMLWDLFDYMYQDDIQKLNTDGYVDVRVNVVNRGLANVQLKAWWDFFRLYFRPSQASITGEELYETVKGGKLQVEWQYGKTRSLLWSDRFEIKNKNDYKKIDKYADMKELTENQVSEALTLKLMLNENKYIPNNKNWILIQSKKDLVHILEPLDVSRPEHISHNFNIGETYNVDFWEYFWSIIYQWYDGWWHHIISPLIDPWFKWPIRTEIVKWFDFNDFIELHIYHKNW